MFNVGLVCIVLIGCASDSRYVGGAGSFNGYESLSSYNNDVKYSSNTRNNNSNSDSNIGSNSSAKNKQSNNKKSSTVNNSNSTNKNSYKEEGKTSFTPPVSGSGHFKPTKSLLGGMRDSEAIQRATMKPYTIRGKTYRPHPVKVGDTFDGIASWYGPDFHARSTSNGETYNMHAHTAAHKTLPMNTIVSVFNKDNGKSTVVRINDRGPFVEGRIIDLSNVAARDIQMVGKGIANVRIEVIGFGGDLKNNNPKANIKQDAAPASKTKTKDSKTSATNTNGDIINKNQDEQLIINEKQEEPIDRELYANNELRDSNEEVEIPKSTNNNYDDRASKQAQIGIAQDSDSKKTTMLNSPQNTQEYINQVPQKKPGVSPIDGLAIEESIDEINVIEDTLDDHVMSVVLPNQNSLIVKSTNIAPDNQSTSKNDFVKGENVNEKNISSNDSNAKIQNEKIDINKNDSIDNKSIADNSLNINNEEKSQDVKDQDSFNPVMSDINDTIQKLKDSTNQLQAQQNQVQDQKENQEKLAQIDSDVEAINKSNSNNMVSNQEKQNTQDDVIANQKLTQATQQDTNSIREIPEFPDIQNNHESKTNKTNQKEKSSQIQVKQNNDEKVSNHIFKAKKGSHMISLNVFSQEDRAKRFKEQMGAKFGDIPYNIDVIMTDKGLFRVALRGFKNSSEAKEFLSQNQIAGHVVAE